MHKKVVTYEEMLGQTSQEDQPSQDTYWRSRCSPAYTKWGGQSRELYHVRSSATQHNGKC